MKLGYIELIHPTINDLEEQSLNHFIIIMSIKRPSKYVELLYNINGFGKDDFYEYIRVNDSRELEEFRYICFHFKMTKKCMKISTDVPIRNYINIVQSNLSHSPQIIQTLKLKTGEYACIIKTVWLKIIQRKWRKLYVYNHTMIRKWKNPLKQQLFQLTCQSIPRFSLRGLFYHRIPDIPFTLLKTPRLAVCL